MKKTSRIFVVDTNIARSAGETDHPVSKACRDFLNEILTICHKVAVTKDIAKEWKKHRSSTFDRWYVLMQSKGKCVNIATDSIGDIDGVILDSSLSDPHKKAALKDSLLIKAALATDYRIASSERKARLIYASLSKEVPWLKKIHWVNPVVEGAEIIAWLKTGAKNDKSRTLSAYKPPE